jgi:epoxyqueuosine reductase
MEEEIKKYAIKIGFDVVGITDASPIPADHIEYLKHWLENGYAGQMSYLHRNFEKRVNPALLLDGAKSIICVGLNYKRDGKSQPAVDATFGKIAAYACYQDYHKFIKEKLYLLADFIKSIIVSPLKFKVCTDSVPLAERSLAARAGLGFIAKNHVLTHPIFGQQLLLGELITNIQLEPDKSLTSGCKSCNRCAEACPTGALTQDGLDARRCVSYLTIENKGVIPQELTKKIGNRLFGCDDCILACGYHKNAPCAQDGFKSYDGRQVQDLCDVVKMDEDEFARRFADSPLLRLGLERFKRNAIICLQNGQLDTTHADSSSQQG